MLPNWTPARGDARRRGKPWTPIVQLGTWRVSQTQLLAMVAVALLTMLYLTSRLDGSASSSMGTSWRARFRRRDETTLRDRKAAVREAMAFVWTNYRARAFGADEIKPLTGAAANPWGGIGCMILDSMDTLYIMDMHDEFEHARQWVKHELRFDQMGEVSVFETIIRSVGGLLSAYDLSQDRVFLHKAVELAERMLPAIEERTGRADYLLDTATNKSHQWGTLAESGTYQLEFEYLTAVTGDPKYSKIAQNFYEYLRTKPKLQERGLFANQIYAFERGHERTGLLISMGGSGDSFYEYLLKVWILTGERDEALTKRMYLDAMDGMRDLLLQEGRNGQLFLADFNMVMYVPRPQMHHLACFVPGMLALGAQRMQAEDPARSKRHMLTAKRLMKTCYEEFYAKQPTGLSPEALWGRDLEVSMNADYKLRPEVVESLYVMYQITGDPMYQDWGWNIFSAIQRHCRTLYGYSEYRDVTQVVDVDMMNDEVEREIWSVRLLNNKMETFFTAETLKYLYLLFDPDNKHVSLATHVFNTEAHPFSIPKKE